MVRSYKKIIILAYNSVEVVARTELDNTFLTKVYQYIFPLSNVKERTTPPLF